MKSEHLFPEDYLPRATNIYEAVLVIAKRSRQIGELQKRHIDRYLGQTEMLEQEAARKRAEESDDAEPPEPIERPGLKFEKPVVLAMEEVHHGRVEYYDEG